MPVTGLPLILLILLAVIFSRELCAEHKSYIAEVNHKEEWALQELSIEERQQALYGATVVHASFGDIELAQMSLRGTHPSTQESQTLEEGDRVPLPPPPPARPPARRMTLIEQFQYAGTGLVTWNKN
jgi:hypothetical protein